MDAVKCGHLMLTFLNDIFQILQCIIEQNIGLMFMIYFVWFVSFLFLLYKDFISAADV